MSNASEEVTRLIYDYCAAIDGQDAELLTELFTADGVMITGAGDRLIGSEIEGYFVKLFAAEHEQGASSKHLVTNARVNASDASGSTLQASFLFLRAVGDSLTLGWGNYDATVARPEGSLRMTSLTVSLSGPFLVIPCQQWAP